MSPLETETVRCETRDGIGYLTLASPPLNILTARTMDAISEILGALARDRDLKAIAFRAEGKAFCAGADVVEHAPDKAPGMIESFTRMFLLLDELELPIVMAVGGAALGGGFELTLMADTLIAAEGAKFGLPEIRLGFVPPVGVARLPQLVGPAKAAEIVCSGRIYSAEEMRAAGLVTRVVDPSALEESLEERLSDYRQASPLITRMAVRLIKKGQGNAFARALEGANRVFLEELMATEDVREGIASFLEKRKPEWKNR
jgi:cyclohexa-1,5-dienecarbonyl-CoA hydratase